MSELLQQAKGAGNPPDAISPPDIALSSDRNPQREQNDAAAEATPKSPLDAALAPEAGARRRAGRISAAAALLWAPQAYALAALLAEATMPGAGWPLASALLVFLLVAALRAALGALAVEQAGRAAEAAKLRIRAEISAAASVWSPLAADRPAPGRVAALIGEMVDALGPYLTAYEPARKRVEIVPLVFLGVAAAHSWVAGLLFIVAGPLIPVFMALIGKAAKSASDERLREVASLSERLVERLRALTDVRLLGAAGRDADAFAAEADDLRARTMRVLSIAFLSSAVLEAFAAIGIALIAVYVGFSLLGVIDFGVWTAAPLGLQSGLFLLLLAPAFFQPLREFAAAYHDRAAAEAFADALQDTLGAQTPRMLGRAQDTQHRPLAASARPILRLENAQAANGSPINFEIAPGDRIAITGPSGAGKSTLLTCLAGLRPLDHGRILIGADQLNDETAAAWRERVAWIGQRPHLVSGSLRANIAFYAPSEAQDATRLQAAIGAAHAAQIVDRAPQGLNSAVGETAGGASAGVSGGEARRLGVARLAFADRDVILADEPTADLDAETAAAVVKGLFDLSRGRTLIVATHDPSLIAQIERRIDLTGSRP
ncbi:MAG: thiol reductant ABC exporter subunit CydD [Neomegalonema sp.]|nr:thiol reductant ABC exporter subunit CydD [Neomegalonema sp.]